MKGIDDEIKVSVDKNEYIQQLKKRYYAHEQISKLPYVTTLIGYFLFVISFLILNFYQKFPQLKLIPLDIVKFIFVIGILIMGISIAYYKKKEKLAPPLTSKELALVNLTEAKEMLEMYKAEKIELYKVEAIKNIKNFNKILSRWVRNLPNEIHLLPEYNKFFQLLTKFRNDIKDRLIPSIEKSDENSVDQFVEIIDKISDYLYTPNINKLSEINSDLLQLEVRYTKRVSSILSFLVNIIKRHKTIIIFISIFILPIVIFLIAVHLVGISEDGAYIAASAFFGTSFTVLISYYLRGEKAQ